MLYTDRATAYRGSFAQGDQRTCQSDKKVRVRIQ